MDQLRWLSVDLTTGNIVCDLPGVGTTNDGPLRRTIMKYESQTLSLFITPAVDPSWLSGTRPGATALIAYRGTPGNEVIHWGGIVLRRQRTLGSNEVQLTVATPECYLDRRYTGAYTTDPSGIAATKDQNTIVADLITQFAVENEGLLMTVTTFGQAGTQRLESYNDYDDKTVYSNITTLSALLNGPEWTCHWEWDRVDNAIFPIAYIGNRIGTPIPAGLGPAAYFDESNLIEGLFDENYSSGGMGANDVMATSSGQGLARPWAEAVTTNFNNRPRWQYRWQPTTSIQDPLTLQAHANRALALIQNGTNTVTLQANPDGPKLGYDWDIGDDIGYSLIGDAFPDNPNGIARCIGYEVTDTYTSPTIYLPQII